VTLVDQILDASRNGPVCHRVLHTIHIIHSIITYLLAIYTFVLHYIVYSHIISPKNTFLTIHTTSKTYILLPLFVFRLPVHIPTMSGTKRKMSLSDVSEEKGGLSQREIEEGPFILFIHGFDKDVAKDIKKFVAKVVRCAEKGSTWIDQVYEHFRSHVRKFPKLLPLLKQLMELISLKLLKSELIEFTRLVCISKQDSFDSKLNCDIFKCLLKCHFCLRDGEDAEGQLDEFTDLKVTESFAEVVETCITKAMILDTNQGDGKKECENKIKSCVVSFFNDIDCMQNSLETESNVYGAVSRSKTKRRRVEHE
jgi:hypothetical protein